MPDAGEDKMIERYLEDFRPGFTFTTESYTLEEEEMIAFARQYDPMPFHVDPEGARDSIFGGLVASGFLSAALVWSLAVKTGLFEACGRAGVGLDRLQWRKPVRPGDTLTVRGTVTENRISSSKPDRGFLTIAFEMINQDGAVVLTCHLTSMVARRAQDAVSGERSA